MPDNDKKYMTIEELAEKGTEVQDCTVRGVIIDVKPGSGLIMRCPECKRALYKGAQCRLHGQIKGVPDLRIKAALDDGTGALIAVLHKEITEKITGHTLAWYQALVGETCDLDSPRRDIMEKVIARPIEVRGRVVVDDYGLVMIATEARIIDIDKEIADAKVRLADAATRGISDGAINLVNGVEFKFGQLVMTAGVNDRVANDLSFAKFVLDSLRRHANGDWGALGAEDKAMNDNALKAEKEGKDTDRLFSKYVMGDDHTSIYIITEHDRSATTVLFPDEY